MPSEDSKKDPAWKYGYLANGMVPNNVTCRFCSKESKGGIHRHKQHLVGGFRNVTACPKCPEDVKKEMKEYMWKKKREKKQMNSVLKDEEESENAIIATSRKRSVRRGNSSNKKPRQAGPMDDALCAPKSATQSRMGNQTTINDACKKELRDKACADTTRWTYEAEIPIDAITLDSFRVAIESLVRYVVGMNPASFDEDKEEFELALRKHLNSMKQNGGKEVHISESRHLQLKFLSNLSLPVFTGSLIEREDCSNIQVALVDAFTGQTVKSGPESSAKVEIVVLEGNFDGDENDHWTVEEFTNNIVREREGKEPLLTGDAFLNLKEGIGLVGDISFTDNSSWTRSRRFRLGARVVDSTDGTRVREAKTDSFTVKDQPEELYKKYYADIQSALDGLGQRRWTMLFSVLKWFSIRKTGSLIVTESSNGTIFLSTDKIGEFDYTQPCPPSPDIFSVLGASCLDDYALDDLFCDLEPITQGFCDEDRLQVSTDFANYKAESGWTMLFSVLKCFSIMKTLNLKKNRLSLINSDLQQWIGKKKG